MTSTVSLADAFFYVSNQLEQTYQFCYIDPPFNTKQVRRGEAGSYVDSWQNREAYEEFLKPIIYAIYVALRNDGAIAVHIDWRVHHWVRCMLDDVFGYDNFLNDVVWHYDFGGRGKNCWPKKHDNILVYAKSKGNHYFDWNSVPRVPYMSAVTTKKDSRFVTPEKAALGKTVTDVWWRSVIGTNSGERTGYPTQKPVDIVERLVKVHSSQNGRVLDCFAGSGTTGDACLRLGREFDLVDENPQAIDVMKKRFDGSNVQFL